MAQNKKQIDDTMITALASLIQMDVIIHKLNSHNAQYINVLPRYGGAVKLASFGFILYHSPHQNGSTHLMRMSSCPLQSRQQSHRREHASRNDNLSTIHVSNFIVPVCECGTFLSI